MTTDSTHAQRNPLVRADRAVNALRHLDAGGGGYIDPLELYAVLVRLTQIANLTGLALDQAAKWVREEDQSARIGTDQDDVSAGTTLVALDAATRQAQQLAELIDAAAGQTGHLCRAG